MRSFAAFLTSILFVLILAASPSARPKIDCKTAVGVKGQYCGVVKALRVEIVVLSMARPQNSHRAIEALLVELGQLEQIPWPRVMHFEVIKVSNVALDWIKNRNPNLAKRTERIKKLFKRAADLHRAFPEMRQQYRELFAHLRNRKKIRLHD